MARYGLIGPSYASQSLNADCQVTKNWYVEQLESPYGKSAMALYPTPGTQTFVTLPGQPVRGNGELEINGRAFAVSGPNFCEVFSNGTFNVIAQVLNDLLPVSMVASPQQLLLASGGNLYVYWLQTVTGGTNPQPAGTFIQVPAAQFTIPSSGAVGMISMVEYIDGFFLVLLKNSQAIYISAPFDASTWIVAGLPQIIIVSVFSDNVVSIIENQRRLYVQGRKRSTVYYDSGSANIFDVDPSGTSENGSIAVFGVKRADNSIFWLDQDERGASVVRRMSGYTPVRVSNHAIEYAMQGYPTVSDLVTYAYQDQGHTFVQFNFPSANKTWDYDVATNMWHERAFFNQATGLYSAHKSQSHMFAFGKHLVGDPGSGNIYQMAIPVAAVGGGWNFATDAGEALIRRERRSPHISTENHWMFHNEVVFDVETGLGPQPPLLDGVGLARGPKLTLSWSNDYGHTWSNEYDLDAGQAGNFRSRVRRSRLGRARDRIYKIVCSDPIPWRIIEGYLNADGPGAEPGYKPKQRLAATYGQVT
jgi:hypothetical protein